MKDVHTLILSIALTVTMYTLSLKIYQRYRYSFLNPVFISTVMIIGVLVMCNKTFVEYRPGKDFMTSLIGPATVALALPLYNQWALVKKNAYLLLLGITMGSFSTIVAVLLLGRLGALPKTILISLAPKSVTAPIAVEIARITGGDPSLAVAFVVATAIIGSTIGPGVLSMLKVNNPMARGVALGTTAHAMGTTVALMEGETQGAMAGIAMVLAAIITSQFAPLFVPFILAHLGI